MYDVIIVGAGPTGATAAKILAENERSVLVVERRMLPRYKSCSGMVIEKSIRLIKEYFQAEIPDFVKCAPIDNYGMVFTNDEGKEYKFEQRGCNVWRDKFDAFLLDKAVASGAKVFDGASVTACENLGDFVQATIVGKTNATVKARYLIDCEGAVGALKRSILPCEKDFIVTYQAFFEGNIDLDPHYFYAYLQPDLSEYDAWFNVKDGMLVLGTAAEDQRNIPKYFNNFLEYMTKYHNLRIDKKFKDEKWIMPHIRPNFTVNFGKDRIFFAGETAGFLNPMGEGISCGIQSGCSAAKAILDHFNSPVDALSAYKHYCADEVDYMKRQWHLVSLLSKKF